MTELATVPVHRPPGGGEFTLAQLRADPLRFHLDPYRRLGPLYRLALDGREVAVIAGPEANEFAWRNTDLWNWPAMKNTFRRAFSERDLTAMEGEGHRRKRRRMVQGFKPGVIEAHTGAMSAALERLLSTHAGRSVDLRWFCNHLILDETAAMLGVDLPSSVAELAIEFENLLLLDVYVFAGVTIPAGTPVMHPREVVHFLDEVYEEPLRFRPERHLGRTHPARVQATFGGGGHICLGLPLARIQSALSLATIARGWDGRFQFAPILDCRMENVLTPTLEHLPVVFERQRGE